jgi:hypothetical protein
VHEGDGIALVLQALAGGGEHPLRIVDGHHFARIGEARHLQRVDPGAAGEVGYAIAAAEGEVGGEACVGSGHVPAPELVVTLRDLVIGERRQVGELGARRGQGPSLFG